MSRPFATLLLVVNFAILAKSQTFFPLPGEVSSCETPFDQANECFIHFENPSGDSLRLHWRVLEASIPAGWSVDLCDYGHCYIGVPGNALMNWVNGATQPYLKLIVQPGAIPGAGWYWFRVYEEGNPDNFQDVYFSLNTPGTTGILTPRKGSVIIAPNPARDIIRVTNETTDDLPAHLYTVTGQLVWSNTLPAGQQTEIHTSDLPSGIYILKTPAFVKEIYLLP